MIPTDNCTKAGCSSPIHSKKWRICAKHYRDFLRYKPRQAKCAGCSSEYIKVGRKSYCTDECRISNARSRRADKLPALHPTHKTCQRCTESKLHEKFGKDKSRRDGLFAYCKDCVTEYEGGKRKEAAALSKIEYNRLRHESIRNDPVRHTETTLRNRNTWLVTKYGITLEAYDVIFKSQNDACGICKRTPEEVGVYTRGGHLRPLAVDHDHSCCPSSVTCGKCIRQLLCHFCNLGLGYFSDNPQALLDAAAYVMRHTNEKETKNAEL